MSRHPSGGLAEEHANGFSSLALLAATEGAGRILYLLSWTTASLTLARADAAESAPVRIDGWTRLPLASGSVDIIVADFDAIPDDRAVGGAVAIELRRVLTSRGQCIAALARSRVPRDRRRWRRYRLVPPLAGWRRTLCAVGFVPFEPALLCFEGDRLTEVRLPGCRPENGARERPAQATALRLSLAPSTESTLVEAISRALREELSAQASIGRIHVRKIGKAAAVVPARHADLVVKLPCSPVAVERARRNYAALQALHGSSAVPRQMVPTPVGHGAAGCQSYFVETRLPGVPREAQVARLSWEPQAVEFITSLHLATARRQLCSEAWFDERIEPALCQIERSILASDNRAAVRSLRMGLRERLIGQELPLVRSHGDFTGSNCLYDPHGRLSGIVDWELSGEDALPLLDLLQCFDLPAEYTSDGRWHRADLVFDAVDGHGPLSEARELDDYIARLRLPREAVPALLLFHWVDHAAARVSARQSDSRWFARRIEAPLVRLRELASRRASC